MNDVRTFVLMGQGGYLTSFGMASLAKRLDQYGPTTLHPWDDRNVIGTINSQAGPVAVIGYSLGANRLGHISDFVIRDINLGVAYDPSRQSPLVKDGIQRGPRFNRLLCYQNTGAWFFGGSGYVGDNVETTKVSAFHLAIQFNEELHAKTIKAVEALR